MRTLICTALAAAFAVAQPPAELRFCIRADPKTFDPLQTEEEAANTIRYLTGGVLIRFDRSTQKLQPELAESWKLLDDGRRIDFVLRKNIRFSDGTPFDPDAVIGTIKRINDPALRSGVADSFRAAPGDIEARSTGPNSVSIRFPARIGALEMLFDGLAIGRDRAVLGPFVVSEYKSGQYVLLRRNPNYWKTDSAGKRLPYLDSLRLDIQANRENELRRFRQGELHLIEKLEPEMFERLSKQDPKAAIDAGPSLDHEFLWFNQVPEAPISAHKRRWFQSKNFRRAISAAIKRDDIVRLVYRGHATPSAGPIARSNKFWYNARLQMPAFDAQKALRFLSQDGFRLDAGVLRDRDGNRVEFSLISNSGSNVRAQMATIIQDDLKKIGIRVSFTPLEFRSLIERISRTNAYEACLLGFANIEIDPIAQTNVWLSSSTHHPWNPAQKKPATAWEAEIDALMRVQAETASVAARKKAFDRVQQIAAEEAPIIYLVHPNVLAAVSPAIRNIKPSILPPHLYWNIEHLGISRPSAALRRPGGIPNPLVFTFTRRHGAPVSE
jgi:peptide/nickel transport system substrate-binding protein